MTESSGKRLAASHRWLALAGLVVIAMGGLVGVATGDYLYVASIMATLAVLVPVPIVLQRNHRRRRADAALSGGFGASCNAYYENVKDIPRFQPLLGDYRPPWWSRLPSMFPQLEKSVMGGGLRIDPNGIVWTPSPYRQRKGMPILSVPLEDVTGVAVRLMLSIGRGGVLEIRLQDGGEWLLSMQDSDEAMSHLLRLGCAATAE